ncbi:hypothetical protein VPNG_10164 [Cytospora leucostoma]|uniref:JmjC domain-containing protein n=1 Tax=Cytospora leucostoma TaxID=1230097 RepID=A0A423VET1_9PEZI|nr:hypothetical protein VPNG_10164 [Cytospora leucostoma]
MDQPIADPLAELITTYNELNSPVIEELDEEPSPLEFMRYVSRNTPFVVRKAAATWPATKDWNAQYLEGCLRDQTVNVAVTPKGFLTQTNNRIGNSRSVTALHKDNYENIYVQIQGQKHFVLLPPHSHPCVNEKPLRPGTYARNDDSQGLRLVMDAGDESDQEVQRVPFAIWDPDCPDDNATPYSRLAEPMRVTLGPGDMLYLPAMW